MNREAIFKTLMIERDRDTDFFICRSPLCPEVGTGKTKEEALDKFSHLVAERYVAFLENRLSGGQKRGRPAKNNVDIHLQIKPYVKNGLLELSQELDLPQGEVVELLLNQFLIFRGKSGALQNEDVSVPSDEEVAKATARRLLGFKDAELPWFVAAEYKSK